MTIQNITCQNVADIQNMGICVYENSNHLQGVFPKEPYFYLTWPSGE